MSADMTRAILIVLDSVGCGGAEDAKAYGDEGADTLGHIAEACADGRGNREGLRRGPLRLPRLAALGLAHAMKASTGRAPPGFALLKPRGQWGYGVETSRGKDTPSGHWELAGTPVDFDWGYFPETIPAFPEAAHRGADRRGQACRDPRQSPRLGNRNHRGIRRGAPKNAQPICYTSADSVLQIAAHEEAFGLERLYDLCRIARRLTGPLNIGRIIARPFVGRTPKDFVRTAHRKDFAVPSPDGNLLQRAARAGRAVVSIGKIGDIFAHRDTGAERKGKSNDGNIDLLLEALSATRGGRLHLRQSGRFRHRIRPPPRRRRLRGLPRGVRQAPRRNRSGDAAERLLRDHRRPRQRSDVQRLRSHARACADPRLRRRLSRRPDRREVVPRRRRRDDRAQARLAGRTARGGLGRMSIELVSQERERPADDGPRQPHAAIEI